MKKRLELLDKPIKIVRYKQPSGRVDTVIEYTHQIEMSPELPGYDPDHPIQTFTHVMTFERPLDKISLAEALGIMSYHFDDGTMDVANLQTSDNEEWTEYALNFCREKGWIE